MKALLFPGQGVQKVGMLNSLFEEVSEAKSIIDDVSKSLDFDLEDLLRNGPEEKINLTEKDNAIISKLSRKINARSSSRGYSWNAGRFEYANQRCL